MLILIGGFLIVFGLGWAALMFVFVVLGAVYSPDVVLPWYLYVLWLGPGILAVPGIILLVIGLSKRKKNKDKAEEIYRDGIPARARVTFVDKNYNVLVNEKPIYSIVEYEFSDSFGRTYTGRKENADSDLVIRNQITVGSEVDIKYLAANPDETVLILHDPPVTSGR